MNPYLGNLLVLLGTIIATIGDKTWDPEKKGLCRLTSKGFAALILAVVGFWLSVAQIRRGIGQEEHRQRVVSGMIQGALNHLNVVLFVVLHTADPEALRDSEPSMGSTPLSFFYGKAWTLRLVDGLERVDPAKWERVSLSSPVPGGCGAAHTLGGELAKNLHLFVANTSDSYLGSQLAAMSPEDTRLVQLARDDDFLRFLVTRCELLEQGENNFCNAAFLPADPGSTVTKVFVKWLGAVRGLAEKWGESI